MKTNLQTARARFQQVWLTLPYKVGVLCVAFSKKRFAEQNWLDTYPEKWQKRKGGKRNIGRALLIDTGRLRRSIRIISTTPNSVTIGSDVPYAAAHNEGFKGTVNVPAHVRKRFIKVRTGSGKFTKSGKERMKSIKKPNGEIKVKAHTKRINLPKRRFMGESKFLRLQISRFIESQINSIFNDR